MRTVQDEYYGKGFSFVKICTVNLSSVIDTSLLPLSPTGFIEIPSDLLFQIGSVGTGGITVSG
jgi:hypothetical protein